MSQTVSRQKMVAPGKTGAEESEAAAEEAKKPGRTVTTLAELGPKLPIGLSSGSGLSKDLVQRSWRTKDERELGKLKKPKMSMAAYVGTVVAYMHNRFGHHEWTPETKLEERRVIIGQAYMPDVFYAYLWLRREVIGNEIVLEIACSSPSCGHKFKFNADLGSTEVIKVDDESALDWSHQLHDPVDIRKKRVTHFRLRAPRWASLESGASGDLNEAAGKILLVKGSIVGLNDEEGLVQLSDNEIDELSKRDLETIASRCNDEFVGPKMSVDITCPKCENQMRSPIDWTYDRFFSISSRQ